MRDDDEGLENLPRDLLVTGHGVVDLVDERRPAARRVRASVVRWMDVTSSCSSPSGTVVAAEKCFAVRAPVLAGDDARTAAGHDGAADVEHDGVSGADAGDAGGDAREGARGCRR